MTKDDFSEHTRYTLTYKDDSGQLKPANVYIYKLHPEFCIVRLTDTNGALIKISYDNITKIVKRTDVDSKDRYMIPEALLDEKSWKTRTRMDRYSSSPQAGK